MALYELTCRKCGKKFYLNMIDVQEYIKNGRKKKCPVCGAMVKQGSFKNCLKGLFFCTKCVNIDEDYFLFVEDNNARDIKGDFVWYC